MLSSRPPMGVIDHLTKDIDEFIRKGEVEKGLRSTAYMPVMGKGYYWWFGRGKTEPMEKESKRLEGEKLKARMGEARYEQYEKQKEFKNKLSSLKKKRTTELERAESSEERRKINMEYQKKFRELIRA